MMLRLRYRVLEAPRALLRLAPAARGGPAPEEEPNDPRKTDAPPEALVGYPQGTPRRLLGEFTGGDAQIVKQAGCRANDAQPCRRSQGLRAG
jgi:hypothetical protein